MVCYQPQQAVKVSFITFWKKKLSPTLCS